VSYLLANAETAAAARLAALGELFDTTSLRHIDALGIAPGWACWEVGAGGPTLVREIASRVGTRGYVLATDLDVSRIGAVEGVDVRVHDLVRDPLPSRTFDLVHARLVLVHVAGRAAVLGALVQLLRPGGWLLLEDADPSLQPLACLDARAPAEQLANRLRGGFRSLLVERGAELAFGRTLPRCLREAGLIDIRADAYFPIASPACLALERATLAQVGDKLVARGLATADELAAYAADLDAGRIDVATSPLISAWGRKPA
jgi:SAM-dependent methyltransferase